MTKQQKAIAVLVAVVAFISFACSTTPKSETTESGPITIAGGSSRFPYSDATDWVTWADQVSVFTVISENQITPPAEVNEHGEGYVGRTVTLRVESTPWSRPGVEIADETIEITTWGWTMHDGRLRPMIESGGIRLEVGGRYIAPLLKANSRRFEGEEWVVLSSKATVPVDEDTLQLPDPAMGNPQSFVEELAGKSVKEVGAILSSTKVDPLVADHMHLNPDARMQAWRDEWSRQHEN